MIQSSGIAIATVHSILITVDIVGNCLVCAIIKKHQDMRYVETKITKADFHPSRRNDGYSFMQIDDGWRLGMVAGISSVVTLIAIAAERYYAVIYPAGNIGKLTKSKLKVIIPGSWIFSLVVNIPLFLALNVKDNACVWMDEEWMPKAYFLYWSAIVVVAMATMALLYSRIVYNLWFKRDPENQLTFQQRGVLRVRKRVTLMGVTVTAIFGICWAPDVIAHDADYYTSLSVSELTYAVIHMLVLFSSAVNPFAYALVNKTFREKLKGMICCSCTGSTASTGSQVCQ
ncbi:pyroglutamylated RFamide peptide receptor-like [Orbicella faveolata]|uniref:pyroglutamylated RFamide peptide receptor-like n=1 Tax=Orbicella faveolata TaxID=48498 RepID=UPI0009E3E58E|nr:pyroglutamylated RFamide peptide receptor-like [Orbicella faveolata]